MFCFFGDSVIGEKFLKKGNNMQNNETDSVRLKEMKLSDKIRKEEQRNEEIEACLWAIKPFLIFILSCLIFSFVLGKMGEEYALCREVVKVFGWFFGIIFGLTIVGLGIGISDSNPDNDDGGPCDLGS